MFQKVIMVNQIVITIIIEPIMVDNFETIFQSLLSTCLFGVHS